MSTYRHDVYVLKLIATNIHIPNSIYLYKYVTSFFSESDEFNIYNYIYTDNEYRNKTTKEETRKIPREIPPRNKHSFAARERKARRAQRREIQFREARQLQLTQCIPR